jgi:hypothetical protein
MHSCQNQSLKGTGMMSKMDEDDMKKLDVHEH